MRCTEPAYNFRAEKKRGPAIVRFTTLTGKRTKLWSNPFSAENNMSFQDTPSGWTGSLQFIGCRVCLEKCCYKTSSAGYRIVRVGPCVQWKKGDKGELASHDVTPTMNQDWQVGMDTDFPGKASGGCFKCNGNGY